MAKDRKATGGKAAPESLAKKSSKKKNATEARAMSVVKKPATAKAAAAQKKTAAAKPAAKKKSAAAKTKAPSAKKSAAKPRRPAKKSAEAIEILAPVVPTTGIEDPIGDVSDGEAHRSLAAEAEQSAETQMEAYRVETTADAESGLPEVELESEHAVHAEAESTDGDKTPSKSRPELHLDRLQKILSQAGIASRRHAEEMIVAGRVMVNGQVVTQLGAKADPQHDHIRVDGKLIERAERHRTFLLNKPKGYVTTVSDPEGRPTVADIFSKFGERLYPVGRLDFQSEGLLLMTNDGELANLLTRAASGVEKIYVVKVAGELSPDQLKRLREGVSIERAEQGSKRVRSAPAEVRQIRPGDNPWYEVVLIEGRNREIRKMFSTTGHFVEKIRRVAYGPLVLDVEPGRFRELNPEELNALRLTAEGKMKPRRPKTSAMLPKEAGIPAEERSSFRGKQRTGERPYGKRREERPFGQQANRRSDAGRKPSSSRFEKRPFRREERPFEQPKFQRDRETTDRGTKSARTERPSFSRPRLREERGEDREKPFRKDDRPRREFGSEGQRSERPRFERKPRFERRESGDHAPRGDRERREFRPREEGAEKFERPNRFGAPRFNRERGRTEGGTPRFDRRPSKGPSRPGFGARGGKFRNRPASGPRRDDRG